MNIEIERRWILIDDIYWLLLPRFKKYQLTQFYLLNDDKSNERLRQIVAEDGKVSFLHTIKTPAKIGQYEDEKEISAKEYTKLLKRIDSRKQVIIKNRSVFEFENFKFEIDQFLTPASFKILEVELPTLETIVNIPQELGRAIEITHMKGLSNYKLASEPSLVIEAVNLIIQNYLISSSH